MNNQIIKTIKIEIAGVEVEVTPEQARNLQSALIDLLGMRPAEIVEKLVWYPYWTYPTYTYTVQNLPGSINTGERYAVNYLAENEQAKVSIT